MRLTHSLALLGIGVTSFALTSAPPLHAQAVSRHLGTPVAWQVIQAPDSATVSGLVLGAQGPLGDVMVSIKGRSSGAITDDRGFFEFEAPPPGEWVLTFRALGFEEIEEPIVVPTRAGVRVTAIVARLRALCHLGCTGTFCDDLAIHVVDASTLWEPKVPIRFRVGFEGQIIKDSVVAPPSAIIGLGKPVETVGWHSLEVSAKGYQTWRKNVWLENVPACGSQSLMGREHTVELVPLHGLRRPLE